MAGLLGLCGVLYSQIAPRQKNINDATASLLTEVQRDRAFWLARCSELEKEVKQNRGDIRNLRQYSQSLIRRLRASGVDVLHLVEQGDKLDVDTDEDREIARNGNTE